MSLLLSKPSLCVRKPVLVRSSPLLSNNTFSSSLPQTLPPTEIICVDPSRPNLATVRRTRLDGITITPWEHKVPMDGIIERMGMIGSSNGWKFFLIDEKIFLHDIPNTYLEVDDWEPMRISLPPLVTLPLCQTQMVTNVAMSSSSPHEEEECVIAIKFLGPQLSFCRSNREWINVQIENPCFFSSRVMFSKKEEMFRIVGSGGHLIGSWDLRGHNNYTSKFRKLRFRNFPALSKTKREILDSCCTSEHLVESPSTDETFMVKWYKKTSEIDGEIMETKALMVFKLDEEEGNAIYTENIGDLIIFLTKSEVFCVPASSFPEMHRNCVKIWDVDETTIVDLAAQDWNC